LVPASGTAPFRSTATEPRRPPPPVLPTNDQRGSATHGGEKSSGVFTTSLHAASSASGQYSGSECDLRFRSGFGAVP